MFRRKTATENSSSHLDVPPIDSLDREPWRHPYLSQANIRQFREYSEDVWRHALDVWSTRESTLDCAFAVNMAQNMHKWASIADRNGVRSTIYTHPMDIHPFSHPYWELFDGDLDDWTALGDGVPEQLFEKTSSVPMKSVPLDSSEFVVAVQNFEHRSSIGYSRADFFDLVADSPSVRFESLWHHRMFATYYDWARELSRHHVCYAASAPFAAYASGIPYAVFSVGGDLQFDCGRATAFGRAMSVAFGSARFLMVSNPHSLGHSRRLGFSNGVYLPYPMDTDRYSPGHATARQEWESSTGPGVFALITTRLDSSVKGYGAPMLDELLKLLRETPNLRIVFLGWGADADRYREEVSRAGLGSQVMVLPPVGKSRLIDYYRSADIVLDQFVYGYYGSSALEAASVGKPVIMFIRRDQYDALYRGDSAPVEDATSPEEVVTRLRTLAHDEDLRRSSGARMREWAVRNHGEDKAGVLMTALLGFVAGRHELPPDLINPLRSSLSDEEIEYHASCRVPAS
jgi:glycosyltransferase involved in cell wall biosynthesis